MTIFLKMTLVLLLVTVMTALQGITASGSTSVKFRKKALFWGGAFAFKNVGLGGQHQIMWPEYWPLIGQYWWCELNTFFWLVNTISITWLLASHWSVNVTWPVYCPLNGNFQVDDGEHMLSTIHDISTNNIGSLCYHNTYK